MAENPIGERLKQAREAGGMSLEDVANRTRIPIRHLQHIEKGEWDALPAPTYSIGFARSYANVVGLNGSEIGAELREELGTGHARAAAPAAGYYEPADPARVPPRSLALIAGAIALLLVLGYAIWRSGVVDDSDIDQAEVASIETPLEEPQPVAPGAVPGQPAALPAAAASGPVVLTATDDVWLRVYESGGGARLFESTLKAGERYTVPSTAQKPEILTGRPNALRVTVGSQEIPVLGPPERTISDVSRLPADLLARLQPAGQPGATPAPPPVPAPANR